MFFPLFLKKDSRNLTVLLLPRYYPSSSFSQHLFGVRRGGAEREGRRREKIFLLFSD